MACDEVLGMNRRNLQFVERCNGSRAILLTNDKLATKAALRGADIPVPRTLAVVVGRRELGALDVDRLDAFALKPNTGRGGIGILLAAARRDGGWVGPAGRWFDRTALVLHASNILDGCYARRSLPDEAIFEELIRPDVRLRDLSGEGLPDVRVLVYRGVPVLAMMRLPTRASGGKANLHQGAVGVGLDLETGRTTGAILDRRPVTRHPDTGRPLLGVCVPDWETILRLSVACAKATGLGYLGADIVLDRSRGSMVLEVNGHPGLDIQIANLVGLRDRLSRVAG